MWILRGKNHSVLKCIQCGRTHKKIKTITLEILTMSVSRHSSPIYIIVCSSKSTRISVENLSDIHIIYVYIKVWEYYINTNSIWFRR